LLPPAWAPHPPKRRPAKTARFPSAFPDTPCDHLHVTTTTRGVRESRSAPWRTKEKHLSEPCGTVHPGRSSRQFVFFTRLMFPDSETPPTASCRSQCARELPGDPGPERAKRDSPGHRPGFSVPARLEALNGRHERARSPDAHKHASRADCCAPLGLGGLIWAGFPRAAPWAVTLRPGWGFKRRTSN